MTARLIYACNSKRKADWTAEFCKQKGFKNITVVQVTEVLFTDVKGDAQPFRFEPRVLERGADQWLVSCDE